MIGIDSRGRVRERASSREGRAACSRAFNSRAAEPCWPLVGALLGDRVIRRGLAGRGGRGCGEGRAFGGTWGARGRSFAHFSARPPKS
jgi:hypothetical protein